MNKVSADLLIQEFFHGVFALPFAYIIWKKTKSLKRGLVVILLTYAMDLDHFLDYFLFYGARFNLFEFLSAEYFLITKRAIVPLHGWEWLAVLSLLAYKRGWKSVFTILSFAMAPHLIYDSIVVGSFSFYSFFYRSFKGFVNLN